METRVRYLFNCMVYRFYTRISWIPPDTLKMYFSLQKMRTFLPTSFLPPSHLGSEFHLVPLPFTPPPPQLPSAWFNRHHHQSLFIHEIVSFYMVFLGIVFKTRLKYSKKLLIIMLKIHNFVPRAFPSKNGFSRPTHFLREKPWGRG